MTVRRNIKRSAKLRQFPVTLAYAITDYKCQGITIKTSQVIIDLARPSTGKPPASSAYVQLSRVQSIQQLSILRPFDPAELRKPLHPKLLAELDWQKMRTQETISLYGFETPDSAFYIP